MNSNYLLLALLFFTLFLRGSSNENCNKKTEGALHWACGRGCTGTPSCGFIKCGNVDNMCFCDCDGDNFECKTTELGYTWNGGIKLANGSYALNGTKGDGKEYKC